MIDFIYRVLEKLGYSEPLHPVMVHISMGLLMSAFVFVVVARILGKSIFSRKGYYRILLLSLIFSFPAVFFGYTDWQHHYGGAWLVPIEVKLTLSGVLLILQVGGLIYLRAHEGESPGALMILALCFLTVLGLGYFGGRLSFGERPTTAPVAVVQFQAGENLYAANCKSCHPGATDILNSARFADYRTFVSFIRNPKGPGGASSPMPPVPPGEISDDGAMKLYHYLITLYAINVLHPLRK
jgi:uncharacterized membrane protein